MITIRLNQSELDVLSQQEASEANKGGWQSLIATFQKRVNLSNGRLHLNESDLERIGRYAFLYGNGGWEGILIKIFSRTLGPDLKGTALKRNK